MIKKWIAQIRFQNTMHGLHKEMYELKALLNQQQNNINEAKKLITEFAESENEANAENNKKSKSKEERNSI